MRDLTKGPVTGHVLAMALPMAVGLLVQTLYYIVDLYFVARLGETALAGVSAAGNAMFLVMAITQILNVGTVALISHAVGRKDRDHANAVFNQAMLLAVVLASGTLVLGYALTGAYMGTLGADAATVAAGSTYLHWFLPGLALQFAMAAMGAALRGTGIVKPTMIVQMLTVLANAILSPILIRGWVTGHPMGVAGAALASTLSVGLGIGLLVVYFLRLEKYVAFDAARWRPSITIARRIVGIGLPAGGEFGLMFVYMALIYWIIGGFGSAAQAGFGLGSRIMQCVFLPAMAIAFAAPAVAGQNFGAGHPDRVRETFRSAAWMCGAVMLTLSLACQLRPGWLVAPFTHDPDVVAVSTTFLGIISWNFVAAGLIFTCSGMFQALGNTWPAFFSMSTRLVTFALPAVWLSRRPGFRIEQVWYVSVATVALQAVVSVALLMRQFRKSLAPSG